MELLDTTITADHKFILALAAITAFIHTLFTNPYVINNALSNNII
jgi:hypothetical protein